MHYYKYDIAKFYLSAGHLNAEETGIYRMLIDYYLETESPIPEKAKIVIRRRGLKGLEPLVREILDEFFTLTEQGWVHDECEELISEYRSKADTARANGKKGGRPRKEKETQENPAGFENKPRETQVVISDNPAETGSKANYELRTTNYELGTTNQELETKKRDEMQNDMGFPVPLDQKEKSKSLSSELDAIAQEIFEFWKTTMGKTGRTMFSPKRKKAVLARLKDYPVDDIRFAIMGCAGSDWNMGRENKKVVHNDLELICRDTEHLERYRDKYLDGTTKDIFKPDEPLSENDYIQVGSFKVRRPANRDCIEGEVIQ